MKKIVLGSLTLIVLFFGCLLFPEIKLKSLDFSNGKFFIKLTSNKETKATIKLDDGTDKSCSKDFTLKQGENLIEMVCSTIEGRIKVTVVAEEQVFSKKFTIDSGTAETNTDLTETNTENSNETGTENPVSSEKTYEENLIEVYETNLPKSDECTAQKFIEKINEVKEKYPLKFSINVNDLSQKTELFEQEINKTKECNWQMQKKVTDEGNSVFRTSYSLVSDGNCDEVYIKPLVQENFLIIETDYKNNSVEIIKGALEDGKTVGSLPEEYQNELNVVVDIYGVLGECFKAWQMGAHERVISSESV